MLELEQLSISYGAFCLGPLDLSVGREVVAVLGPSGCGKTTLLKRVAGLAGTGDKGIGGGTVSLEGKALDALAPEARGAALVFQEGATFPHLSARQNIAYAASSAGDVAPLAEQLEIEDVLDRPARTLSGGERRRVEVARALAAAPRVLLLDEPTTGLDTPIKRRLRRHLRAVFSDLALPVLYVTHDQREAAAVADRVAVMRDGSLHQVGPPAEVFERPATPFVASFTGNPNVLPARLTRKEPRPVVDWDGRLLRVPATSLDADLNAGDAVWLCIRPEQIRLEPFGPKTKDGLPGDLSVNTFEARVEGRVFEGGTYVLTVSLWGADTAHQTLEVKVLPTTFRRLDLRQETRVLACLAPDALHLIPRPAGDQRRQEEEPQTTPSRLPVEQPARR